MVDDALEALFTVEPENFTATRDAIVKRMRADKRKEEAAVVASLRRPPATVWAMNQVVRSHPGVIDELLFAGHDAVVAQNALLRGGTIEAFNAAVERRRDIVTALVNQTLALLKEKGVAVDQLATSLRSAYEFASIDNVIGPVLQRGQLTALPAPSDDETVEEVRAAAKGHLHLVPDLPSGNQDNQIVAPAPNSTVTPPNDSAEAVGAAKVAEAEQRRREEEAAAKAHVEVFRTEWEGVLEGARREAEEAANTLDRLRTDQDSLSGERIAAERELAETNRKRVELLEAVAQLDGRLTELDAQLAQIDLRLPELQSSIASTESIANESRERMLTAENALLELARAELALGAETTRPGTER